MLSQHLARTEERPLAVILDTLHEQVWNLGVAETVFSSFDRRLGTDISGKGLYEKFWA